MTGQATSQPGTGHSPQAISVFDALKSVLWLAAIFTQAFPYFLNWTPPAFARMGVFVSVIGISFLLLGRQRRKNPLRRAIMYLVPSLLVAGVYHTALQYWTVQPPRNRAGERQQIGFYMAEFSLTNEAIDKIEQLRNSKPPIDVRTPNELMNIFGVWGGEGRTDEIWKVWSIVAAASVLVLLYIVTVAAWAFGLGCLLQLLPKRRTR
jgi:disulfide bond formation protein DsbB